MLRHVFSLSYVAFPVASLLGCWLLVRRRAPALMLFPLLWFLLNLTNFSAVSQLLSSLYLTWPLVLAMLLAPGRYWTRAYAGIAAPMLATLHPLAFLPAFALALLATALAWLWPRLRWAWGSLAALLLVAGLFRLVWTITGVNSYERGRLQTDSAINYLMTETLVSTCCSGSCCRSGSLWRGDARARRGARLESAVCRSSRLAAAGGRASDWSGGPQWTRHQAQVGRSFVVGLVLMGLAAVVVLAPLPSSRVGTARVETAFHGRVRIAALIATCMVMLLLVKSAAWWTATRGLQNLLAETRADCVTLSANEPFGLQWPWMAIIDDWATPMNAWRSVPLYWCSNPIGGSSRCR